MRKTERLTWLSLALGICLLPAAVSSAKVITPADKTLVKQNSLIVLGRAPKGTDVPWSVRGTARTDKGITRVDFGEVFEVFVLLEAGRNVVTVDDQVLEIFYDSGAAPVPKDFLPQRLHGGDITRCEDCHDLQTMNLRDGGFPEACLGCHSVESQNPRNRTNPREDMHFQKVISGCGSCHEAHVSKDAKLLKRDGFSLCAQCHAPQSQGARSHRAFEQGGCVACHDAHFSGFPKGLKDSEPKICNRCHPQGAGLEPARQHSALKQDRPCSLCHNAHGAETPKLLRAKESDQCLSCHSKVLAAGHKGELSSCSTCHDPHLAKGGGLLKGPVAGTCSECHDKVAEGKTLHAAAKEGCQTCHAPHSDTNLADAKKSCFKCHDLAKNRELAGLHGGLSLAVTACAKCHPAHASQQNKLVRAKLHYPLTQGKCSVCHGGGEDRSLAVNNPAARCRLCHTFEREAQERGERIHKPVASGECTACHDPHMSNNKGLLLATAADLCRRCHDVAGTARGRTLHPAVDRGEGCLSCHSPHASKNGKLLKVPGNAMCRTCHTLAKGHHTVDVGGAAGYPKAQQFPQDGKEFSCLGCHAAHGSDEKKLVKLPKKELCVSCHEEM